MARYVEIILTQGQAAMLVEILDRDKDRHRGTAEHKVFLRLLSTVESACEEAGRL